MHAPQTHLLAPARHVPTVQVCWGPRPFDLPLLFGKDPMTGKTYAIVIHDASGRTIEVDAGRGAEQMISGFATTLQLRIPWVACGYSDELRNLYRKSRRD